MIRRGEIYWVNLDPTVGSEIKKTRPCLVISNNQANQFSSVITVVPITSSVGKIYPFEVALSEGDGGIKKSGVLKINQIKTIDKTRISGKPLGSALDQGIMKKVAYALKIHLSIE